MMFFAGAALRCHPPIVRGSNSNSTPTLIALVLVLAGLAGPLQAETVTGADSPAMIGESLSRPDTALRATEPVMQWETLAAVPDDGRVVAMAIWQDHLYVAADRGGMYRYEAGRWETIARLPEGEGRVRLGVQEALYAARGPRLFRFQPRRANWELIADFADSVAGDARIQALAPFVSRGGRGLLVAGFADGRLAVCEDGRTSLLASFVPFFRGRQLHQLAAKDHVLFAVSRDGEQLVRSDGLKTAPAGGFDSPVVMLETVALPEGAMLLAGTAAGTVYGAAADGDRIKTAGAFRELAAPGAGFRPAAAAGCGGTIVVAGRDLAGDLQVHEYRPDGAENEIVGVALPCDPQTGRYGNAAPTKDEVTAASTEDSIFIGSGNQVYRGYFVPAGTENRR